MRGENVLKKFTLLCYLIIFTFTLLGCSTISKTNGNKKFTMNYSITIGTVDNESLDKTKITYEVVVSGNKDDINNINAQEPLINMEYIDLMLENGPHNPQIKGIENPYLEINGSLVFNTAGKSKEEIDGMNLFQGIIITDKDDNEYTLKFSED